MSVMRTNPTRYREQFWSQFPTETHCTTLLHHMMRFVAPGAGDESVDPMEMLDYCMTQRVRRASARYTQEKSSLLYCFSCGCEEGKCFIVLTKRSVQSRKKKGGTIKCPIHDGGTSSSTYAVRFYDMIKNISSKVHGIVWDWHDVPSDEFSSHRMHIDASVFCDTSCKRFEIDGETHFWHKCTVRDAIDEDKDYVLHCHRVGLLRLHYRDVEQWEQYVRTAMESQMQSVRYTKSYEECLHPAEHEHIMKLL